MSKKQVDVASLKKGSYVIFDGVACKVTDIQTSKPGKHGHTKCRISAVALIGDQKKIKILPGHDKVDVPLVEKKTAQVLSVSEDIANVMDLDTFETFDLKIPAELKSQVNEGVQVMYWTILEEKVLMQVK